LSVTDGPTADAGSATAETCETTAFTVNDAAFTNGTILWTHNGSGTIVNATTISPTYTPSPLDAGNTVTLTLTVTGNGSCAPATDTKALSITDGPTADAGSATAETCETTAFTVNDAAFTNGTVLWTHNGDGTLTDQTTISPTYTPAASDAGTTVTLTLTVTGTGSCAPATDTKALSVTDGPTADAGSDETICNSTSIFNFSDQATLASVSNFSSILWTTAGSGTLFNANTLTPSYSLSAGETGVVTFTLTAFGNGTCSDIFDNMTLTINPAVIADAGSNEIICENPLADQPFDFSSRTAAASVTNGIGIYLWSANPIGSGTFDDDSALDPIFNINAGFSGKITFTLTAEGGVSCGDGIDKFELEVKPTPIISIINNPSNPSTINSGETTDIDLNVDIPTGLITLNNIVLSMPASISGFSPVNTIYPNGFKLQNSLINNTNNPQWIDYTFTADVSGCGSITSQTVRVNVNPAPQMTVVNSEPILCSGEATSIALSSTTFGAEYRILDVVVSPNADGVTGFDPVPGVWSAFPVTIADILVNGTDLIQTVSYSFEVRASSFVSSAIQTAVVTVNPAPVMTIDDQSPSPFVSGQTTDIRIATPTQNGQVRLKSVTKGANITGNTAAGVLLTNGAILTDLLNNSSNAPQDITYEFEAIGNGCTNPVTTSVVITVNPVPQMTVDNQGRSLVLRR
jgi:hypothetical protein